MPELITFYRDRLCSLPVRSPNLKRSHSLTPLNCLAATADKSNQWVPELETSIRSWGNRKRYDFMPWKEWRRKREYIYIFWLIFDCICGEGARTKGAPPQEASLCLTGGSISNEPCQKVWWHLPALLSPKNLQQLKFSCFAERFSTLAQRVSFVDSSFRIILKKFHP